ncbi:MAG TPA: methyltransferase domain-containing protein [Pyrinomonadaceae bacterium]|jgi:SAM-dependent methyltransferase|nr:methyltransferase domain-containing protein [Pyrinomonadaceae bacterium]
MSHTDWEARYQAGDMPWEKGAPSPGLVDFLAAHRNLTGKTICVPGCGTGNDVCEWAKYGFDVSGFDIAPRAISLAKEKTKAAGIKAKFQLADFLHDEPPFQFDWVFEHTLFCAIHPDERNDYVRALLRWLKPDGNYLAVNYLICEPDGPPFPTTREEQFDRFSPHFELLAEWTPRSYPNREGKERMFWWRRSSRTAPIAQKDGKVII